MIKLFSSKFILGALALAVILPTATYAATADSGNEETEQTVVVSDTNCTVDLDEETQSQVGAIKAQVEAGEITEEEAKAKLEDLGIKPRHHRGKQMKLDEETRVQLEESREQIEAGELTEEEAKAKLEQLGIKAPLHMGGHTELDEGTKAKLDDIKAQVESGEITKEEAKAKFEELGIKPMGKGRHFGKHGFDAPEESGESTDESL
ncbi:MAG: hypothetical protein ACQEV7_10300 [Bacillota bacterium]